MIPTSAVISPARGRDTINGSPNLVLNIAAP